jgi:FkbH-like protein
VNFLEARKVLEQSTGGERLDLFVAMSGTPDTLELFVRAAAACRGFDAHLRVLPFNTLRQALLSPPRVDEREVFVVFPWDLVPSLDWRSGVPGEEAAARQIHDEADSLLGQVFQREGASVLYVAAPTPPISCDANDGRVMSHWLAARAGAGGAVLLAPHLFSLSSYLSSGAPFGGSSLGDVADFILSVVLGEGASRNKVLVTDLDNTLWSGVIGEDGPDGIQADPAGRGFRHFIYQTFLLALRRAGVVLAAVSRNDEDLAKLPLQRSRMPLGEDDFVCIAASYGAKSALIKQLADSLSVGLDAVVFVDDNPLELEDVRKTLPQVTCLAFPTSDEQLPRFLDDLNTLFSRSRVTEEDRKRTELYRTRLEGLAPRAAKGADLRGFLRTLEMELAIHDRTAGDRDRAIQLINKTNQFNLNGARRTHEEIAEILACGGRLYSASLRDRHGTHGEILACLIDRDDRILSLVLSCRVLQRHVEHAFLAWLLRHSGRTLRLEYSQTKRNLPFQQFFEELSGFVGSESPELDPSLQLRHLEKDLSLFKLLQPTR